jgi:hypothetical protein
MQKKGQTVNGTKLFDPRIGAKVEEELGGE